jgi:3-isopropylmalate dehydrogenase
MAGHTIVSLPGDGIGKIVLPESIRVLEAAGFKADWVHGDIGWEFWCKEGNALPDRTVDLIREHRIGLFGAITSKPKDEAAAELDPALANEGFVYYSPIVALRQLFNLQLCVRPCLSFPNNPLNFVRQTLTGGLDEPKVDVVVFRQNTEGLYGGVEWTNPPDVVRQALETHPKMANFKDTPSEELAVSTRIFTRKACDYICEAAFVYAQKHGYRSVTICEKPNVIRETSGMMGDSARAAKERHPEIDLWFTNIDAQMMWLTKNPEDYGLIVAGNMFGDIISDGFAGLVGGLGFACSANAGDDAAVFEPTHGSAPKYADYATPIVNPIAMILSACMMLDHLDETEKAGAIRKAIAEVVREGNVRTYDMLKVPGREDVVEKGAASTMQMTDAIIERL